MVLCIGLTLGCAVLPGPSNVLAQLNGTRTIVSWTAVDVGETIQNYTIVVCRVSDNFQCKVRTEFVCALYLCLHVTFHGTRQTCCLSCSQLIIAVSHTVR